MRAGAALRVLTIGNRYPPWSLGGYENIWARAVAALRERGHAVRVLTTAPDPSDLPGEAREPDVHRDLAWYWRNHAFPPRALHKTVALERANAAALSRHLAEFRPDAVMWWAMGGMSLSLLELARRGRIPALGVVGDEWMVYGPAVDAWLRRWRGRRSRLAPAASRLAGVPATVDLDRVARWMFISEYLIDTARGSSLSLPGATVAHPGVDPARFAFAPPRPWGWRMLCCGRIDPRKGLDTAVRALARLPEATLVIDGSGDARYQASLVSLARELGVEDRVEFVRSPPERVPDAYAACDVVAFPVRWREPWGLVPLEGMATGRPVIASRAGGGPAEYLLEEQNCLGFDPDDDAGLAHAVQRLAGDPPRRERLVDAGRATAARLTESSFHDAIEAELTRTAHSYA